ncbi:MAG: hypothetical protein U0572_02085 [Phycisphaerales bacterium]
MPRRASYRTQLLADLERQLAFTPPEAMRRQMEAAEALAREIDDGSTYPFEFVVWRLTGFRPGEALPRPIDGAVLRGDLATFVLHCSERVPLPADARPGGAVPLGQLARELGVVEKTLRRWRGRGLLCHRVLLEDGRSRLAVFRSEFDEFARRHPDLVEEATRYSRMDPETARGAIAQARELVDGGLTPNLAAKQVAESLGRSHETVRQLLQRTGGGKPGTTLANTLGAVGRATRDRRVAYRAWRFGVPIERIAEHLHAKPDAVRRRIDAMRTESLRKLDLRWVEFATFERADAESTILAALPASRDLAPRFEPPEAIAMLEALSAERTPTASTVASEDAMLAAYNLLKRRAKSQIDRLAVHADRAELDRIETDLKWALRLKRRLAERWLATAAQRVQQSLGGPLERRPVDEIRSLLGASLAVIGDVIEEVDPSKRQSPRRVVALEIDRMLARVGAGVRRDRAAVRHVRGGVRLDGFFDRLAPWQAMVDRARSASAGTGPDDRLLSQRHGWDGGPPRTLEELAAAERTTVARIVKRLADAERVRRDSQRKQGPDAGPVG